MKFEQWLYWKLNFSILYQRQAFLSGNMEANVFSPTQAAGSFIIANENYGNLQRAGALSLVIKLFLYHKIFLVQSVKKIE